MAAGMTGPVDLSSVPTFQQARDLAHLHRSSTDITTSTLASWVRRLLTVVDELRETIGDQEQTLTEYRDELNRAPR